MIVRTTCLSKSVTYLTKFNVLLDPMISNLGSAINGMKNCPENFTGIYIESFKCEEQYMAHTTIDIRNDFVLVGEGIC